jgi:pyruvate dehydrogenase E1 component beta subunit
MAEISERFVLNLKAPIGRVSGPDSIFPFAQAENDWAVKAEDIVNKVKEVVDYD